MSYDVRKGYGIREGLWHRMAIFGQDLTVQFCVPSRRSLDEARIAVDIILRNNAQLRVGCSVNHEGRADPYEASISPILCAPGDGRATLQALLNEQTNVGVYPSTFIIEPDELGSHVYASVSHSAIDGASVALLADYIAGNSDVVPVGITESASSYLSLERYMPTVNLPIQSWFPRWPEPRQDLSPVTVPTNCSISWVAKAARRMRATPVAVMATSYGIAMAEIAATSRVPIAIPYGNRSGEGVSNKVGSFSTSKVHLLNFNEHRSFAGVVNEVMIDIACGVRNPQDPRDTIAGYYRELAADGLWWIGRQTAPTLDLQYKRGGEAPFEILYLGKEGGERILAGDLATTVVVSGDQIQLNAVPGRRVGSETARLVLKRMSQLLAMVSDDDRVSLDGAVVGLSGPPHAVVPSLSELSRRTGLPTSRTSSGEFYVTCAGTCDSGETKLESRALAKLLMSSKFEEAVPARIGEHHTCTTHHDRQIVGQSGRWLSPVECATEILACGPQHRSSMAMAMMRDSTISGLDLNRAIASYVASCVHR